jgi:hypothetical protein
LKITALVRTPHSEKDLITEEREHMITITIEEQAETYNELALVLQEVQRQLTLGNTSGYNPDWSTEGEEEDISDDD